MWIDSGSGVKVEGTEFVGKLDMGKEGRKQGVKGYSKLVGLSKMNCS